MLMLNVPDVSKRLRVHVYDSDARGDKHVVANRKKDDQMGHALGQDGLPGISLQLGSQPAVACTGGWAGAEVGAGFLAQRRAG